MNKKVGLILFGILAFGAIVFFGLFEKKTVANNDWTNKYELRSKDPKGLYVFHEMLKKRFGSTNVVVVKNANDVSQQRKKSILIFIGDNMNDGEESNIENLRYQFQNFGSSILYVRNDFYLDDGTSSVYTFGEGKIDRTTFYHTKTDSSFIFDMVPIIGDSTFYASYSTIEVDMVDNDHDTELPDEGSADTVGKSTYSLMTLDTLIKTNKYPVFCKLVSTRKSLQNAPFYVHSAPMLFSNISAKQEFYAMHFNAVFDELDGEKVYLFLRSFNNESEANPIRYIMEQKPLRTAYYVLFTTLLLYLIFGSKRLFRPISIIVPPANTSLAYIDTLARLYEYKNDNYNLVMKMRDIFYHKIQKKYYIFASDHDFNEVLSKKSKADISIINSVQYYFKTIEDERRCSDDQLLMLSEYIKVIDQKILEN
jgi:hypothetical protein